MRVVNEERGVVSVLVVGMVIVLIGFAALAVDISSLYQERRTLQNGADAAALAAAVDCAATSCGAFTDDDAKRYADDNYAGLNADDGLNVDVKVCGTGPGLTTRCDPVPVLPAEFPAETEYVEVTTSTYVNFSFAPVLGIAGKTVRASAVVAWGSPGQATTLPLAFSLCEYEEFLRNGPLQAGPPFSGAQLEVSFGLMDAGTCSITTSGLSLPGGFGWLIASDGCVVDTTVGGLVAIEAGKSVEKCPELVWQDIENTTVLLPIYGEAYDKEYRIVGFAAFHVMGYKFTSGVSWPTDIRCPGSGDSGICIKGFFTDFTTSRNTWRTSFGGPYMGVTVIKLVG